MNAEIVSDKLRIIIVDDSDFSRKSIIEILSAEGHDIVGEADSAEKAIKVAQSVACDLFIVDVVMPEVSGIELAKHLSENYAESKIIIVSSLKIENIIIESISNGAIDFIQKPFALNELAELLYRVAQGTRPSLP